MERQGEVFTASGMDVPSPLSWKQILAQSDPRDLPFQVYFSELQPLMDPQEWDQDDPGDVEINLDIPENYQMCVIEPPLLSLRLEGQTLWGNDSSLIEQWFDDGELLEFSDTELYLDDEPDRWARALGWMRSLAIATRILPA